MERKKSYVSPETVKIHMNWEQHLLVVSFSGGHAAGSDEENLYNWNGGHTVGSDELSSTGSWPSGSGTGGGGGGAGTGMVGEDDGD